MNGKITFDVLGPLEIHSGESVVHLPPQRRQLLSLLLCRPNQLVSADGLIDALWAQRPPRTAGKSLQVQVHRLRRALGDEQRISHRQRGYVLSVGSEELDAARFETLIGNGRAALTAGRPEEALRTLRHALDLWRGQAYAGDDDHPAIADEARRLTELLYTAQEDLIDAELSLGMHASVVGRLATLVSRHPFREYLRGQLMLALYRLGRTVEALDVYRQGRRMLVEELGLEPGAELRRLECSILADEVVLYPYVRPSVSTSLNRPCRPREMPMDSGAFVGREHDLRRVKELLTADRSGGPAVVVVDGMAGVGKSALAVHVSHQVAERFPDGQLYADLQGSEPHAPPREPGEMLTGFLGALGLSVADIPTETAEAAARFRSLLADRRMLVVLDNAVDGCQVTPLLPGGSGCAALVTSRCSLATLPGADALHHHYLDMLPDDYALQLLGRLIGTERVADDPEQAARIVRWCGGLPLAVHIVGARLGVRPDWPIGFLADRLAAEQCRLDELRIDDLSIRSSIGVSHRAAASAPNGARSVRMLQLLGVHRWEQVTVSVAAQLTGVAPCEAEEALERLTDMRLLESFEPGRYRMHELVRLFAAEQAAQHLPKAEIRAALRRVIDVSSTSAAG